MPTPDRFKVDQCRTCHQPIIWAVTVNGKAMPVDAEPPLAGGNIALESRGANAAPRARVVSGAELADPQRPDNLRTSHFARCRQAATWRSRPQRARP